MNERCQGCGTDAGAFTVHSVGDGTVQYCAGCETLRQVKGIAPGEHEQYLLDNE